MSKPTEPTEAPAWKCGKEGCDLTIDEHGFALVIEHIYGGLPTKDGGTFGKDDAEGVADRVARKLLG